MLQMSSAQFDAIRSLTSFFVGTILAIHFNYFVYLVIIIAAIPGFLTDIKYGGITWSIYAKDSPEQRRLSDLRFHLINRTFLIETKLLQSGKKILTWMRDIMSSFLKKQINLEKNKVWHTSITDIIAVIGFAVGLILVVRSVIAGEILVGSLVYMMSTLSSVRNSISQLLENVSSQYENHLIVKDMMEIFDTKPVIIEPKNPIKLSLNSVPEIVFENVSFKYPNSDNWSLKNVSLKLSPGNKIGLVGNNGAGKTTFVKLLCRIYDPVEGRILVNGVDLREISTKEWWSYLGVMFQDYASYDFVVKEAIQLATFEVGQLELMH